MEIPVDTQSSDKARWAHRLFFQYKEGEASFLLWIYTPAVFLCCILRQYCAKMSRLASNSVAQADLELAI